MQVYNRSYKHKLYQGENTADNMWACETTNKNVAVGEKYK